MLSLAASKVQPLPKAGPMAKTSPAPPREEGKLLLGLRAPHPTHVQCLRLAASAGCAQRGALSRAGINASVLNVSSERHSPDKAPGMLCHGMGCGLARHAANNRAASARVPQECCSLGGEGGGRMGTQTCSLKTCLKTRHFSALCVSKIRR